MRLPSCDEDGVQPSRKICQQANVQYAFHAPACQKLGSVSVAAARIINEDVAVCMHGASEGLAPLRATL